MLWTRGGQIATNTCGGQLATTCWWKWWGGQIAMARCCRHEATSTIAAYPVSVPGTHSSIRSGHTFCQYQVPHGTIRYGVPTSHRRPPSILRALLLPGSRIAYVSTPAYCTAGSSISDVSTPAYRTVKW
eukprot:2983948-Rhodomonas_salina.2